MKSCAFCEQPRRNRFSRMCVSCYEIRGSGPFNPETRDLTPEQKKIRQSGYNAGYKAGSKSELIDTLRGELRAAKQQIQALEAQNERLRYRSIR